VTNQNKKKKQQWRLIDVEWEEVSAPKVWRPKVGEELIGHYHGRTVRSGTFGEYEVVQVSVPGDALYNVSGTRIVQLFDSASLESGEQVRIVFKGYKELQGDKKLKVFELYVSASRT